MAQSVRFIGPLFEEMLAQKYFMQFLFHSGNDVMMYREHLPKQFWGDFMNKIAIVISRNQG